MKKVTKHNLYGTYSLTLSDKNEAKIFNSVNDAIKHLKKVLLCGDYKLIDFDEDLFCFSAQCRDDEVRKTYSIFNFGVKSAIFCEIFKENDCGRHDKYFYTNFSYNKDLKEYYPACLEFEQ